MEEKYEVVIGLEVHTQLNTRTKIFSGASTEFGAEPNTQANIYDLALPGVLPVLNGEAVKRAVKFGLAIDAEIGKRSVFARKNYFYPDLPKGYQISQFELPIVEHGELFITDDDGEDKRIGITRAHLEEDAGKSVHDAIPGHSGIDLNWFCFEVDFHLPQSRPRIEIVQQFGSHLPLSIGFERNRLQREDEWDGENDKHPDHSDVLKDSLFTAQCGAKAVKSGHQQSCEGDGDQVGDI